MGEVKQSFIQFLKDKIEKSDDVGQIDSMLVVLKMLLTQQEWDNYLNEVT